MKKLILLVTLALVATAGILSCSTSSQDVDSAAAKVAQAENDLNEAKLEYTMDMEVYRAETNAKIRENQKSIDEFKSRIASEKTEAQLEYNQKINKLEQKNSDMKKKLDDVKMDTKEQWEAFKAEFSSDMDALGKAFKDLTVNNNK